MSFRSSRKGRRARPAAARPAVLAALCLAALVGALVAGFARVGAQGGETLSAPKVKSAGARARGGAARPGGRVAALGASKSGGAKTLGTNPFGCTTQTTDIALPNSTNTGTLASGDCRHPEDSTFYDAYSFNGVAGQLVTVELRSEQFNAFLYLVKPGETTLTDFTMQDDNGLDPDPDDEDDILDARIVAVLPTTGTYTILANTFTSFSGGGSQTGSYELRLRGGCGLTPIGQGTRNDALSGNECTLTDGSFVDVYSFTATAGQQVSITMSSTAFDTFLMLLGPDGFTRLAENDDGAEGGVAGRNTNSRVPGPPFPQETQRLGAGLATLPATGTYYILANSFRPAVTGAYELNLTLGGNCASTPISVGQTVNGSLTSSDCRLPFDGSFLDSYTLTGTAGQQIAVTLTSPNFDAYLFLNNPAGQNLVQDNSGAGGTNARIPALVTGQPAGFFTLPTTGTYTIYANSAVFDLVETTTVEGSGSYTLTVTSPTNCAPTLPQTSRQNASGAGGQFADAYTVGASCAAPTATSNAPWITNVTVDAPDTSGAGFFRYTLAQNNEAQSRTGTITVGGQTFTVTQLPFCTINIFPAVLPFPETGGAGRLTVVPPDSCQVWTASTTTPWITINTGATGSGTGRVTYTVAANNTGATRVGSVTVNNLTHTVTQTSAATTPSVEFGQSVFNVSEGDATRRVRLTITRLGDTTGAVTVDFRTIDPDSLPGNSETPCNPERTSARGTAFARCDYATTIDTLTFNPGQVSKTFDVPLIDDVHFEGTETFSVELNNPRGATVGVRQTAPVVIADDDTAPPTTNPIRTDTRVDPSLRFKFFVRMHYLDFLSREPEDGEPWTNVLNNCPLPFNSAFDDNESVGCDRLTVSRSFFESPEFRLKGFFVFLYHKVSFGSSSNPNFFPNYFNIVADMRRVTGFTPAETIAKRLDFSEDWVLRSDFLTRYPTTMTAAQFVDTLLANVGATLATADPNSGATRNSLVADLASGAKTRAQVLRIIVESREVNDRQFNHAFVAMQFYGYLRRTPDESGYQAWLNAISPPRSESPRIMVFGFIESTEYLWRFGSN